MYHDVIIAGFGGQGVLFVGNLLAQAGMEQNYHVTFMPAYGVEMRGGTANCNVVLSSEEIGSPLPDNPCSGLVLNEASLERFQSSLKAGGSLFVNSTLAPMEKVVRTDIQTVPIPANELAVSLGNVQVASLILLGAFVEWTGILTRDVFPPAMEEMLPPQAREKFLDSNLKALEEGFACAKQLKAKMPSGS